ncbi:hypothetical protein CEXT_301801 [Caerostris extrusa]|uniref:Kinesin motor domain-containing protein n=1 Tax=Caerostris extrusa TaxID=172846 RepID=A0AAV4X6X5_CAEEX|nr:hypothetical protein CEXT_301801 [Caerostris extrusa]
MINQNLKPCTGRPTPLYQQPHNVHVYVRFRPFKGSRGSKNSCIPPRHVSGGKAELRTYLASSIPVVTFLYRNTLCNEMSKTYSASCLSIVR